MAKIEEFKASLEQAGLTNNSIDSYSYGIRNIELKLAALDMPYQDLDQAWETDRFAALHARLRKMHKDARAGGQDYRILTPNSDNPHKSLSNLRSHLRKYGQFLAGEVPKAAKVKPGSTSDKSENLKKPSPIRPVNLILHGPPGTGKTFTTAAEAVRLCGGSVPKNRAKLMEIYQRLSKAGRIEFVTFHQSMSYEDFVEGRQPMTDTDGEKGSESNGFRLETVPGIFRQIAERAKASGGPSSRSGTVNLENRQVFKMSIDQQMSEDAQFFEEVTKGGHILLDSQNISQNKVEIGDIIVVSDGHKFFCAIGEVRGEKKRPNQNGSNHHFVKHLFSLRVPMIWGQSQGDSAAYRPLDHVLSAHLADPKRQTMRDELMGVGMRIVEVDGDEGLFVASTHEKIAAHFRGTRWAAGHAGMMRNMDGVPMSRRILGHVTHGFRVSLSDLKKFVEDGTDNEKELDISNSIRTHRPEFEIPHRLPVNWLWVDRAGVSAEEIYQETFPRDTIYLLKKDLLIIPALEQYMNSGNSEGVAKPKPFVLIIDEINRANISKVFGELITLLESDKRLNQPNELRVRLPYSGDKFGVPSNLHIIGTMNTADRSIALLDTALRRRFTFREMMPDAFILSEAARTCGIDLPRLLSTINERIEYLYDREHQIGHAYFIACKSRLDVDEKMRHEIIPLLAEYFFDDWGKIAAVLGDLESHEREINGGFLKRSVLEAPPGLEDDEAVPRFRWRVRTENEGFDYGNLVGA